MYPRWPVEIHPIGRTAAATLAWRHLGRLRVSVVAKASFAFTVDGSMPLVAPDDLHVNDVHHDGSPARSLRAASDLVPYRTQADVVLVGHAPVPDESATVRLAVYRDRALIDKSFDVVPSGDLEGSHRVPLVYEQTPGGPGWDDNPVGTSLPSIVDSSDPLCPVGFGPIAATWPARARRLGAFDPRGLSAPIPVLPDDLDWRYYSAAPADQVTDYLHGDEWIVLENLIVDRPLVRMQLPQARADARIFGLTPAPIVNMLADNLHLDLDRGVASVTWRGSFEVAGEDAMAGLAVMVGVAVAGQPIAWPALPPPRREPIRMPAPPPSTRAPLSSDPRHARSSSHEVTTEIADEPTGQAPLPFAPLTAPRLPAPRPPPPRISAPESPFESTMTISDEEADREIAGLHVLPFAPAPASRPAPRAVVIREPSASFGDTAIIEDEPEETTVPMAKAFRRGHPDTAARPSQGIPGAPWSGVPAAPVPRPSAEIDESTRAIRRDPARLGPAAPAPPPPASVPAFAAVTEEAPTSAPAAALPPIKAPTPPSAPLGEAAPSWSWVSVADAPKVDLNPPRPPRPPPTPAVKNALYNRFTAKKK